MSDTDLFDTASTEATITAALRAPDPEPATEQLPRPRIRTGAVIWGLLLTALGGWVLWIAGSSERRADALDAVLGLDAFGWTVIVLVLVGGLLTLLALAAVIRRAQTRHHHPSPRE